MLKLDDLHDAILNSVDIDVDAKTITFELTLIQFEMAAERVVLVARDWRAFSCPRQSPWGQAAQWCVNVASGPDTLEDGLRRLTLEMQSGDTIEVNAVALERSDVSASKRSAG